MNNLVSHYDIEEHQKHRSAGDLNRIELDLKENIPPPMKFHITLLNSECTVDGEYSFCKLAIYFPAHTRVPSKIAAISIPPGPPKGSINGMADHSSPHQSTN